MHRAAAALVEPWGRKRPSGASPRPIHFRPGRARSQSGCPAAVCAGCLSGRLPPWPSPAHSMTTGNFLWVSTDRGWEAFCLFHRAVPQLVPKAFKRTCSASSPRPARPASGLLRLRAVAPALPCFLLQPEWAPLARPRRCSLGAALGGRADAAAPEGRPTRALALAACRARGTSPPGLPLAPPGACTPPPPPTPAKHPVSHSPTCGQTGCASAPSCRVVLELWLPPALRALQPEGWVTAPALPEVPGGHGAALAPASRRRRALGRPGPADHAPLPRAPPPHQHTGHTCAQLQAHRTARTCCGQSGFRAAQHTRSFHLAWGGFRAAGSNELQKPNVSHGALKESC